MRMSPTACSRDVSTMSTWLDFDTYRVGCLWASSPQMLMFLLADLSSMKPNCFSQRDDDVDLSAAREPLKSSRLMLMRCPEGASNDQGCSRLPHTTPSPPLLLFSDDGNRNFCSVLIGTWHERSAWTTTRKKRKNALLDVKLIWQIMPIKSMSNRIPHRNYSSPLSNLHLKMSI